MPAPASEDDLKRRARRRLIGAVALTLVAVIALPLLLEDEPPPAERLEVRMPPVVESPVAPELPVPPELPKQAEIVPVIPVTPTAPEPKADPTPREHKTAPAIAATVPEKPAQKPKPVVPPEPKPKASLNVPPKLESKPVEAPSAFVVQLGAFSDAEKALALKDRAADLGLPTYTDKSGQLTRLRVGPFPSRQAAIEAAETLADDGVDGQVMPR